MSIHCEAIWNIVMSSNFLNTLYIIRYSYNADMLPTPGVIEIAVIK